MQLGGYNSRYLPKECYYPQTNTAETAVLIEKANNSDKKEKIIIEEQIDGHGSFGVWNLKPAYIIHKVKNILSKSAK